MEATHRVPPVEWEFHKEDIYTLYVTDNKTLEDVIKAMAGSHGFRATKAQYVRKLKQWHMEKNLTNEKWKFAASQIEKRKLDGKETEVLINGKLVPSKKLKKETARYAAVKAAVLHESVAETGVPSGIVVRTPLAEAVGSVEYTEIPWFQFQECLEAYIGRANNGTAPISMGNYFHNLPGSMSFGAALGVLGSPVPLSPLSSTIWDPASCLLNDAAQDSFPNMFGDEPAFDWGTILHTPQPPFLPAAEKSNRGARKLLGLCLDLSIDPDSPRYVSEVSSELESITIQNHGPEAARHVQQLYGGSAYDPSFQLLRYAVYLSSNGLLSDSKTDELLKWVIEDKKIWVLERLIDAEGPTIEIFASNLLVSAARLDQIDALRALLAKGVDPNSLGGSPLRRLALQRAAENGSIQLVQLLLDAGADPNAHRGAVYGKTALEIVISGSFPRVAIAKMLTSRGADVNATPANGDGTLLHLAVLQGNPDLVRVLLRAGARVDAAVPGCGTALQLAARCGNVKVVEILLEAGADVDSPIGKAYEGVGRESAERKLYEVFLTPLQLAAKRDDTEIVQILLDAGADVNDFPAANYLKSFRFDGSNQYGWESDTCISNGRGDDMESGSAISYARWVFDHGWRWPLITALQASVSNNNVFLVRLLLSLGAKVDTIGANGTALQIAASEPGRIKLVQLLLSKGADVNSPGQVPGGRTALQAAAESGNEDTVQLLLRMGADVNAPPYPQAGCTAVQAAAKSGNLDLVRLLVDTGADVHADAAILNGRTCLQSAAERGDINLVNYLLHLGVSINEPASPRQGRTALQAAIENEHKSVAERLLEKGADANGLPSRAEGLTALEAAVNNKWYDLAQLLLGKGASPNVIGSSSTPLGISIEDGALDMVRRLIDSGADANRLFQDSEDVTTRPLPEAAYMGNFDMVRILLDAGARIDGMYGTRTLMEAVTSNSIDIVKLLLSKGASPNSCPGSKDDSVLSQALYTWSIDMVRILVDAGARVDADHGIALRLAAKQGSVQAVEILLQAGADVNAPAWEPRGKTALQGAVKSGNLDLVVALLNRGADINAPPSAEWGSTALQIAASDGSVRMVQFLLAHGADVNGPPSRINGATALQKAVIRGHLRILLMLLKSGADINAAGAAAGGQTALDAAAEHGRLDIMHLLLRNCDDAETMEARCKRSAKLASSNGHPVLAKALREWKRPGKDPRN